ncbi:MAG: hypothetical protein RLZZ618_3804 [Pseudomonadota bacterium]|jgi:methyltransferase (TIGR00027 family)
MLLKIGELAKRVGLTVRTLHHYDRIGLLSPSVRSDGGFRLYGRDDVARLHRIQALKQFGCGLSEVHSLLDASAGEPLAIVQQQLRRLDDEARRIDHLRQRLRDLAKEMASGGAAGIDDWLTVLEMMNMHDKHLSDADRSQLQSQRPHPALVLSDDWVALIRDVKAAMDAGRAADHTEAQQLAWQWMRQLRQLTGQDAGLALRLRALLEAEPRAQDIIGVTPAMLRWVLRAWTHGRLALFAGHLPAAELAPLQQRLLAHLDAWLQLMAAFQSRHNAEDTPQSPAVQVLAARWQQLYRDTYIGENPALEGPVRAAFTAEPDLLLGMGFDTRLSTFVQQAVMERVTGALAQSGPTSTAGPKPSAMLVANLRAAHQLVDQPLIFTDPLALTILGTEGEAQLRAQAAQFKDPTATALRTSLVVRSQLVEDQCSAAVAQGVLQTVILGAGLDTFAYRHPPVAPARMFEVDLPPTQQWKRDRLREAGMAEPAGLRFVPMDFERTSLQQGLAAAGFDATCPAFYSWLGVTMYLDEDAILSTLKTIAAGAIGTTVVFDYLVQTALLPAPERAKIEFLAARIAERGEPWKTFFDPDMLTALLHRAGFSQVQQFTAAMLDARYLKDREDGMRVARMSQLVQATV